jgi:hypothetical protein
VGICKKTINNLILYQGQVQVSNLS